MSDAGATNSRKSTTASASSHPPEPALVPELLVTDLGASLAFWCDLCGFQVLYDRPDEGFAAIALGDARVLLEQVGVGRNWITAPLSLPFGRGMNLQVAVPAIEPLVAALERAGHAFVQEPETAWYRVGDEERGVRQFVVADPDGYCLRFQASAGIRPAHRV